MEMRVLLGRNAGGTWYGNMEQGKNKAKNIGSFVKGETSKMGWLLNLTLFSFYARYS